MSDEHPTFERISAEEWAALPPRAQRYIYELETQADPSGTVREAFAQKENADALGKLIEEGAHGYTIRDGHVFPKDGGACVVCDPPEARDGSGPIFVGAVNTMQRAFADVLRADGWTEGPGIKHLVERLRERDSLQRKRDYLYEVFKWLAQDVPGDPMQRTARANLSEVDEMIQADVDTIVGERRTLRAMDHHGIYQVCERHPRYYSIGKRGPCQECNAEVAAVFNEIIPGDHVLALELWPWLPCTAEEWEARTPAENARWLLEQLEKRRAPLGTKAP